MAGGDPGKVDPLSAATRSAKRNLLLAGTIAIAFRAFEVSVTKTSVSGLDINFKPGVFYFFLIVVLIYFLVQFGVYYYVDVRNYSIPPHLKGTDDWARNRVRVFVANFCRRNCAWVDKQQNKHPRLVSMLEHECVNQYKLSDAPHRLTFLRRIRREPPDYETMVTIYPSSEADKSMWDLLKIDPQERDELASSLRARTIRRLKRLPFWCLLDGVLTLPRPLGVQLVYGFRKWILDGALPLGVGLLALAAIVYDLNFGWLVSLVPSHTATK